MTTNTDPVRAQYPTGPALEIFRLRCQADRLESMFGMNGAAENIREAADKLEAALASAPPSAPVGKGDADQVKWLAREYLANAYAASGGLDYTARCVRQGERDDTVAISALIAALAQQPAAPSGEAVAGVVWDDGPHNPAPGAVLCKRGCEQEYIDKWGGKRLYLAAPQQPAGVDELRALVDRTAIDHAPALPSNWDSGRAYVEAWMAYRRLVDSALAAQQQGGRADG